MPVTIIPQDSTGIRYDSETQTLHVGDGAITGVLPEVWAFSVSGLPVLERWLGSRTAVGVGRAASPSWATPLDRIRPEEWEDEWNDELLDLLKVLTHTVLTQAAQADLLERIVAGGLIRAGELPVPSAAERAVPKK